MAAVSKDDVLRKFPTDVTEAEDITAITKQISDHAEAIYETWKNLGLAPTEILNYRCNIGTADQASSPLLSPSTISTSPTDSDKDVKIQGSSFVGILSPSPSMDNNVLEKMVNKFVVEDKARIAATKRMPAKYLPSSIKFAVQAFENNLVDVHRQKNHFSPKVTNSTSVSPTYPKMEVKLLGAYHNEVILPTNGTPTKPGQQKRPNNSTVPSLQNNIHVRNDNANYLAEVTREEERLIDALKKDVVILEEPVKKKIDAFTNRKPINSEEPSFGVAKRAAIVHNDLGVLNSTSLIRNGTHATTVTPVDENIRGNDELSSVMYSAKVRYLEAQRNANEHKPKVRKMNSNGNSSENLESSLGVNCGISDEAKIDKEPLASVAGFRALRPVSRSVSPRPSIDQVPHPERKVPKKYTRTAVESETGNNLVRPFLTRGSVAERILIFEKSSNDFLLDKRGPWQPEPKTATVVNNNVRHEAQKVRSESLPQLMKLNSQSKPNITKVDIPRFYFPDGNPPTLEQEESTVARIVAAFQSLPGQRAPRPEFHVITKACDIPHYWKVPLFIAAGGEENSTVEMSSFLEFWKELSSAHRDAASKFVRVVTRGQRNHILPEDLIPLVQDVIETHPGLSFLKEVVEFHSRYIHTVIARIFYCVNRSWSSKISIAELRRSDLLSVISILEKEEDINKVTAYFSYEHFYVIYCKFWELDQDHDLFIDKTDLTRHDDHALSKRIIDRIFSGVVRRRNFLRIGSTPQPEDKMSYTEFVWFLLSEEDKTHPTAIEYWFRCMDLDGDGYLSIYELEYFYEEQLLYMDAIGVEALSFQDCICQILDMVRPVIHDKISLRDLKKCKMTSVFFDTFFNLEKYLDHEQKDPFATVRDLDDNDEHMSNWDRFAAEEYELLVEEENSSGPHDASCATDDELLPNLEDCSNDPMDVPEV